MEKILVNGGAGFIDSHVADVFLGKGYDMAILEELSAGFEANIKDFALALEESLEKIVDYFRVLEKID